MERLTFQPCLTYHSDKDVRKRSQCPHGAIKKPFAFQSVRYHTFGGIRDNAAPAKAMAATCEYRIIGVGSR